MDLFPKFDRWMIVDVWTPWLMLIADYVWLNNTKFDKYVSKSIDILYAT